ncbi:MAG TPA: GGDEF domain-containing protein [Xanthobacteraceae bacterium]|jgi:diguanylate cyclase (GGDEF)-like protein|nr:GGDEF domain-containing protein [Xanthobacteraceae bacterium]
MTVPSLSTLLAITAFTPILAGCLLLLSWLQHRSIVALAWWGSGFITASIATTIIVLARGTIPDFWSIIVGNALLAAAYGLMWCGARTFNGEKTSILLALAGVPLWIAACAIAPIYERAEARASVMAAIAMFYTLLTLLELWRGRGDGVWRWPIMLVLLAHAAAIPVRIPLAAAWIHPDPSDAGLLTFMIFETAFVCFCAAYLLGSLAKDQIAASYRRISLTDSLTHVPNRRGFFETAERLLMRTRFMRRPVALLMFDLDCFKSINDRYGHQTGDEMLIAFCRLSASMLRPTDLFGRIGGEEFATLLPGTDQQDALALAERLRTALEGTSHTVGGLRLSATVSVGIAVSDNADVDLGALLKEADQALYRAKELGRNRVEVSGWPDRLPPTKQRNVLFPAA